jgi:predicted Zn-dependent protease
LPALEIELKQNRVDAALARLDKVMAQSPRKETWLVRRGEILQQAGRTKEAVAAFQAAQKALDTLPPTRRTVPAMAELEQRLRKGLAEAERPQTEKSSGPTR